MPVEGWISKEPTESILGNGAFSMQESEQDLSMKGKQNQFLEKGGHWIPHDLRILAWRRNRLI